MEAWRCVRRGYGRCVVGRGRPLRELPGRSEDIFRRSYIMNSEGDEPSSKRRKHQGYHCEYKMRTGRKPDGCAICFKHSKFSLLSVNPVEFYRPDVPLLDRDNVGLVLLLQPKIPKISSVAHQKDGSFCPIVMCGDFNSVPGSPLYSFIKEGKLNYEGLPIGKLPLGRPGRRARAAAGEQTLLNPARSLLTHTWAKYLEGRRGEGESGRYARRGFALTSMAV
ncbi:hypothetical protein CB1_002060010 [Camelus ferus]|nr:hypothetical protein CB1_002060010 [Camelus ferus]